MTATLALRKNDTRITSRFIKWWTDSIYSHCEIVVAGVSYSSSAMDGGVRGKVIQMDADKWDFIELHWADSEAVKNYFTETDHLKYGWAGLIVSQLFNSNRKAGRSQFCSQWCASALGLPNAASYSPSSLKNLCKYISKKE